MDHTFSAASLFAVYTSLTAIVSLFRQFYYQFVPVLVRDYIANKVKQWFNKPPSKKSFTLFVNQHDRDSHEYNSYNLLYMACQVYISDKLRYTATRLRGNYRSLDEPISYQIARGEQFVETLEMDGVSFIVNWKFSCKNPKGEEDDTGRDKSFEISFDLVHKNEVLDGHIPLVVVKYYEDKIMKKKDIYLFTFEGRADWKAIAFNHPFTFDALALDPELKQAVIDDLDKFIKRKEFYKRVGRAWKRGYLLYGPPGTGKSSLVAAMANYLRFDIYDLQLGGVYNDATLRKLMLSTRNKSILVIEDIDCSMKLSRDYSKDYDGNFGSHGDVSNTELAKSDEECEHPGNQGTHKADKGNRKTDTELSLSGLLNFIDGLWSSCGDERIIVFTTNQKEKLDPALLRPGRMDMHINMSYLTMHGFKILVNNYLGFTGEHALFEEIEQLLATANVTPAQIAEELIRIEDVDAALSNVVEILKKRLNEVKKPKKATGGTRNH